MQVHSPVYVQKAHQHLLSCVWSDTRLHTGCAEGRKISVTDLGSTNGTYLDEEELPPNRAADLYVGSRIVFGESPSCFMA